jgi:hypothetical protein
MMMMLLINFCKKIYVVVFYPVNCWYGNYDVDDKDGDDDGYDADDDVN